MIRTKCTILLLSMITIHSWSLIVEKIILRVNEETVSLSAYQKLTTYMKKLYPDINHEQIVEYLVSEMLLFQLARDHNIEISEEELSKDIRVFKQNYSNQLSDKATQSLNMNDDIEDALLRQEIRKNKINKELLQFIVANRYVSMPTRAELKEYYQNNMHAFYEKEQVQIAHILLRLLDEDIELIQVKEKLGKQIVSDLLAQKSSFASLAQRYSDDLESKDRGGVLGWFDQETLRKVSVLYSEKAFQMNVNETSPILYTDKGLSIIYIVNKKPPQQRSFEEAANLIQQNIVHERAVKQLNLMLEIKRAKSRIYY